MPSLAPAFATTLDGWTDMDFCKLAVSDAGPRQQVMVYQRLTGRVTWKQPWYMPYWFALARANKMAERGLNAKRGKKVCDGDNRRGR